MIAAALLMLAEASADAGASSKAVTALYEQACVQGELRLNPRNGSLVDAAKVPEQVRGIARWIPKAEQIRFVKMTDPAQTYLVLITYENPRPRTAEVECYVASQALSLDDATDIFTKGTESRAREASYLGTQAWSIHEPDKGYTKVLRREPRGWTVLGVTTYRKPN